MRTRTLDDVVDGLRLHSPNDIVCFGGRHRNRLFMAASHSLYALFVNVQGAVAW
jgi:sugar lactone lactonase YvrE